MRNLQKCLDFITGIEGEQKLRMLEGALRLELRNKDLLFSQDEPAHGFYVVLSGVIKLTRVRDGSATLLDLVPSHDMIGALLMQPGTVLTYPVSALSMGASLVLRIPRETYLESWVSNPLVQHLVQEQIRRRMQALQNDRCIQRLSLEQRVAYFVMERMQLMDTLSITRREIADGVGTTAESVIRLLRSWEDLGFLETVDHKIRVLKPEEIYRLWRAPAA
jgi:CRP-like cAMP-binding protein